MWTVNMHRNLLLFTAPAVDPPPPLIPGLMPASIRWAPDEPDDASLWSGRGSQPNIALVNVEPFRAAVPTSQSIQWFYVDDTDGWGSAMQSNMGLLSVPVPPVTPSVNMDLTITAGVAVTISINGVVVVNQ